jgi:hypothetical protein
VTTGLRARGVCTCDPDVYGEDCSGECACQNGGVCDDGAFGTGACTCPSGFFGPTCGGVCACAGEEVCDDGDGGSGTCYEPMPSFRVQRGSSVFPSGLMNLTVSSPGSFEAPTGPAFVRIVSTRLTGMGRTDGQAGAQSPGRWTVWISAVTEEGPMTLSSFTLNRFSAGSDTRVTWEIIEYIGPAHGPNAIEVRNQSSLPYASGSLTTWGDETPGVFDDADVVVFLTGQGVNTTTSGDLNRGLSTAAWDARDRRPTFTRGESGSVSTVSYAVVEFTGSNWTIERINHDHDLAGLDTRSLATVTDISRAFAHVQYRSTLGRVDELGAEVWTSESFCDSGSTCPATLNLELEATARPQSADIVSVVWIISNSAAGLRGLQVDHYAGNRSGATVEEDCWHHTVAAVPSLEVGSIWGETARSRGQNLEVPRGAISLMMTDVDTVSLCQSDNGEFRAYRFSIVRWPYE